MRVHYYAPDSGWTIMRATAAPFVVLVYLKENQKREGAPERMQTVACIGVEADDLEAATQEADRLARADGRPFTRSRYRTWELTSPPRMAGMRDNARID